MLFSRLFSACLAILPVAATPLAGLDAVEIVDRGDDSFGSYFFKGHDLSSLKILEDGGAIYKDTSRHNQTRPADDILADGGMNTVRLRLWVNPPPESYGLGYTLDLAKRFAAKGFKIYLDFHFSDTWADPNHNLKPVAWPTELKPLAATLRKYVADTIVSFRQAGIDLAMVSLGNEIRHGLLWPTGQASVDIEPWSAMVRNFTNLATLYKAAREGVDDAVVRGAQRPEYILIHIDDGWNLTLQERWFGAITDTGIVSPQDWDLFGFSFYPFYGTAATFENLRTTLNTLAHQYRKPIQVVETDWPDQCNGSGAPALSEPSVPVSAAGQTDWVRDIINVVKGIPYGLGRGVHYWEPAWLNSTSLGSACQSAILFDADFSKWPEMIGYSLSSVDMFKGA